MVQLIALEGNIGSGKTSLCAELRLQLSDRAIVVCEPVKHWMDWNYEGENFKMLQDTYHSNEGVFDMQTFIQFSMLRTIYMAIEEAKLNNKKYVIFERTLASSVAVFSQNAFDSKALFPKQYAILRFGLDTLKKIYIDAFNFDKIFYLYCSPDECLCRVRKRNRPAEKCITLEYLKNVNKYYDCWYDKNFYPLNVTMRIKVNAQNSISDLTKCILLML